MKLSTEWKPTALIAVINARADLSDMEKANIFYDYDQQIYNH